MQHVPDFVADRLDALGEHAAALSAYSRAACNQADDARLPTASMPVRSRPPPRSCRQVGARFVL